MSCPPPRLNLWGIRMGLWRRAEEDGVCGRGTPVGRVIAEGPAGPVASPTGDSTDTRRVCCTRPHCFEERLVAFVRLSNPLTKAQLHFPRPGIARHPTPSEHLRTLLTGSKRAHGPRRRKGALASGAASGSLQQFL